MDPGAPPAPARRRQPHGPPTSAETRRAHLLALYINRALNPVLHFTIKQLLVEDGVRGPFVPVAAHVTPQKTSARAPSYALEFPGRETVVFGGCDSATTTRMRGDMTGGLCGT